MLLKKVKLLWITSFLILPVHYNNSSSSQMMTTVAFLKSPLGDSCHPDFWKNQKTMNDASKNYNKNKNTLIPHSRLWVTSLSIAISLLLISPVSVLYLFLLVNSIYFVLNMGGFLSRLFPKSFGKKETRILMLGLDAAGKTSKCVSS